MNNLAKYGSGDPQTWSPCTNHPMDPRTPDAPVPECLLFEEYERRLQNPEQLAEAFSEASDEVLKSLATAIAKVTCESGKVYTRKPRDMETLVALVVGIATAYCWPEEDWEPEYDD